jgi:CDP-diacylglycerol--glycerol-3-phosphate 3-phosphatidyltransferase
VTAAAAPGPGTGPDQSGSDRLSKAAKRFGQNAVATPANFLTVSRILVAIPTLVLIHDRLSSWLTVALWFAVTSTDSLDGWMARRDGATRSGAFLDPVADKLIVLGGLAVLADIGVFPWWPVAVIAIREFGISLYRSLAARRGVALPAQRLGKYKAFTQYCAVGFVLLPWTADNTGLQNTVLGISVLFTVVSRLQILLNGYRAGPSAA